jgi:hypothetical protein
MSPLCRGGLSQAELYSLRKRKTIDAKTAMNNAFLLSINADMSAYLARPLSTANGCCADCKAFGTRHSCLQPLTWCRPRSSR